MTAWTSSRSRCVRERHRFGGRPGTRSVQPGSAHPPAVAGSPRPLAGRRGMALPVVGGGVPAVTAGAPHSGRRGSAPADHPRGHSGGQRAVGRSVLPRRHASLAGQLAAARGRSRQCAVGVRIEIRQASGIHAGSVASLRSSRMRGGGSGARRFRHPMAARRQSAAAQPGRCRHGGAARRPAGPSVPAAAGAAAARIRAARRPSRRRGAPRGAKWTKSDRDLGARMRLRPGYGTRLRRRRSHAFHG